MISIIRRSAKALLLNLLNLQACKISSRKSVETFITKHFPRSLRHNFGRKYSVLIETAPDIATECGVSAGIHTARSGGTTQTPCSVRRVITPLEANNSWSSGCECSGITCPCARSADTLAISPRGRRHLAPRPGLPPGSASMRPAPGPRHVDPPRRSQSSLAQGPRRQQPLHQPAHVLTRGNLG